MADLFTKNAINKRENIRKWVKALRSGKYQQIRGRLYDGTGYCCLGVACDVLGLKPKMGTCGYEFAGRSGILEDGPRRALGLRDTMGEFDESALTEMNDDGKDFREIAKVINKEFKRQFGELP